MLYRGIVCVSLFAFILCVGCGLKEGVVQKDPKSFLWFTGDTDNVIVYIDDLEPIELNRTYFVKSENGEEKKKEKSENIHYEISPGKHRIIIKKSDKVVVNRIVLLGNGIIKEIQVP